MSMSQVAGVVVLAVGVVLLGFAFNASNAPLEEISHSLTGRYSDQTMLYLVLGIGAAVGGVLLLASGRHRI